MSTFVREILSSSAGHFATLEFGSVIRMIISVAGVSDAVQRMTWFLHYHHLLRLLSYGDVEHVQDMATQPRQCLLIMHMLSTCSKIIDHLLNICRRPEVSAQLLHLLGLP